MLHLSIIRQHFDSSFSFVVSLVEGLEQQIESLTLAQQSPFHTSQLQKTVIAQRNEIIRLSQVIEDKSELLFKFRQVVFQSQNKLKLQLAKAEKLNRRLEAKFQLHLSNSKQLNSKLQARIRESEKLLESDRHSAPKLDSHNSGLPPSLDPPWNKPKRSGSLRRKSGQHVGGALGHQGFTLRQISDSDQIIVHRVNVCQHCQHLLIPIESRRVHKRQIFEIENGGLSVIEHQAEVKLCPFCRQISKGSFPVDLKAPVQYGTSVFSRIVYLNQYQLLPINRTAESMNNLFACPISWATISRAAKFCSDKLLRSVLKIKAGLRNSEVLGVDETGVRINGKIAWVHVARTDQLTHLAVHSKRGQAAFDEIGIINRFTGILVRDGFLPYQRYEQCRHSLCNAHLLRNSIFVSENEPAHKNWTTRLIKLLLQIKDARRRRSFAS